MKGITPRAQKHDWERIVGEVAMRCKDCGTKWEPTMQDRDLPATCKPKGKGK